MDIARVMVKVRVHFYLKEFDKVSIDGVDFNLLFRENPFGPVRINITAVSKQLVTSSSEDSWNVNDGEGEVGGEEDCLFVDGGVLSSGFSDNRSTDMFDGDVSKGRKLVKRSSPMVPSLSEDLAALKATFCLPSSFDKVLGTKLC